MAWPRRIVFVRHAESEGNVLTAVERTELEVATHNYALTAKGRAQAKITGEYIRKTYPYFDFRYV